MSCTISVNFSFGTDSFWQTRLRVDTKFSDRSEQKNKKYVRQNAFREMDGKGLRQLTFDDPAIRAHMGKVVRVREKIVRQPPPPPLRQVTLDEPAMRAYMNANEKRREYVYIE